MNDYQTTTNTVYIIENGAIKEVNYHDLMLQHAETTTTPAGVGAKYHLREEAVIKYEAWTWGQGGNFPRKIKVFDTKEEADEWIFELAMIDFDENGEAPQIYQTEQEAQEFLKSLEEEK